MMCAGGVRFFTTKEKAKEEESIRIENHYYAVSR